MNITGKMMMNQDLDDSDSDEDNRLVDNVSNTFHSETPVLNQVLKNPYY